MAGATITGNVDILGVDDQVNLLISDLSANNTAKEIRFGMRHYTNSEEPVNIMYAYSGDGIQELFFGGATSLMNGLQTINFCTAATSTTTGGTTRMTIDSSGMVLPGADNTYDLGSSSKRWANLYVADMHLKNDRGDWTVIEEEDYLSLKNNKNGKTYKLVMEEV
jgi:hypothetical protein